MKRKQVWAVLAVVIAVVLVAALVIRARFERDLAIAAERAAQGSELIGTRCGPIEVQQAGTGIPLLIPGAKFVGFDDGGHLLVGHDAAVRAEIAQLLVAAARP